LRVLKVSLLADTAFKRLPVTLEDLQLSVAGLWLANAFTQQELAASLCRMPRLARLVLKAASPAKLMQDATQPDIAWNLPALQDCELLTKDGIFDCTSLGRVIAPKLVRLKAHVINMALLQLLADCPVLTSLCTGPLANREVQAVASISKVLVKGGMWPRLTVIENSKCVFDTDCIAAMARSWALLVNVKLFVARNTRPSCVQLLLRSLPLVGSLRLKCSDEGSQTIQSESNQAPLHAGIVSLDHLNTLSLSVADNATLSGLLMPNLQSLNLEGAQVTLSDLAPVLASCPRLSMLELQGCPLATTAELVTPASLVYLRLEQLPALSEAACARLLRLCRQPAAECEGILVSACPQLTEITLATIISLRLRPQRLVLELIPAHSFSTHLAAMLGVLITALGVREIQLGGKVPPLVKTKTLETFGTNMHQSERHGVRIDITVNKLRWELDELPEEDDE